MDASYARTGVGSNDTNPSARLGVEAGRGVRPRCGPVTGWPLTGLCPLAGSSARPFRCAFSGRVAGFHDAWQQDVLEPSFHFIPEMGQESDRVDDAQ